MSSVAGLGMTEKMSFTRTSYIAVAAMLCVACYDPFCAVGARLQVSNTETDSCAVIAMKQLIRRNAFDSLDIDRRADFTLTLRDSSAPPFTHRYLHLRQRDSTLVLEVMTSWMGTSKAVPVHEQRRFVAEATSLLETIRAACAPTSPATIQCVRLGVAGRAACEGGG